MLYQGNYFAVTVKLNFCQRQSQCVDDKNKFQFVTDNDNEFTECQTPRKKLQSIDISPVSLHVFMKTLKSNISEAYKVHLDCLKNSESDSYDKKEIMKEKVNDWLGCTRQCKKNRKQHHIQNKSKLLPQYLINGLECTDQNILMSYNILFEFYMKSKKQVEYQQNLLLKKEKLSPLKQFIWKQTFKKMAILVGKCLNRKTMLV